MAAFLPPGQVMEEVHAFVRSVVPPGQQEGRPPGWRRKGKTPGRRRSAASSAPEGPLFDERRQAQLPLAKLGHLSAVDVQRLTDRLEEEAATWPAPLLRVEGVDLDVSAETGAVHVVVSGDVAALEDAVRGFQQASARLQLFVDRRAFRPLLDIGTLTQHATEEYAEALLDALAGFVGQPWWQSTLSLGTSTTVEEGSRFRTHADVALQPPSGPS